MTKRVYADERPEDEACQAGTVGCCIDHEYDEHEGCETW